MILLPQPSKCWDYRHVRHHASLLCLEPRIDLRIPEPVGRSFKQWPLNVSLLTNVLLKLSDSELMFVPVGKCQV
jgi:fatty acid desaturase